MSEGSRIEGFRNPLAVVTNQNWNILIARQAIESPRQDGLSVWWDFMSKLVEECLISILDVEQS